MENLNNLPPYFPGNKAITKSAPADGIWQCRISGKITCGPRKGDVVKILNIFFNGNCYLLELDGYPLPKGQGFTAINFEPIQESPFPSLTWSEVVKKESTLISQN